MSDTELERGIKLFRAFFELVAAAATALVLIDQMAGGQVLAELRLHVGRLLDPPARSWREEPPEGYSEVIAHAEELKRSAPVIRDHVHAPGGAHVSDTHLIPTPAHYHDERGRPRGIAS